MGKFIFGAVVGAAGALTAYGMLLSHIWNKGDWHKFAFGADAEMSRITGRPKQLVDLSDLPKIPSQR